jgi:hypothetical protein
MDHDQFDHSFYDYAPTIAFDCFLNEEITGEAFGRFSSQKPFEELPVPVGKRKNKEKGEWGANSKVTATTGDASSQQRAEDKEAPEKRPPRKPAVDPSLPKQPVERPHLYLSDPNNSKRGKCCLRVRKNLLTIEETC